MPFGLGFFATAGAGGAAAGAFEHIQSLSGSGSLLTFSSIPTDYKHLQLRVSAKNTDTSTTLMSLRMRVNGDTGSNYSSHRMRANSGSSSLASQAYVDQTSALPGLIVASQNDDNSHSAFLIDLLDYRATNKNKTFRMINSIFWSNGASSEVAIYSSVWRNSASPITSISFLVDSGAFKSTSRFSLYGVKG